MNPTAEEFVQTPAALGDRIRDARRKLNMTQGELAGNDYSVSYISAIERNKIRPSLRALSWLADRLNVKLSDLLANEVSTTNESATTVPVAEDDVQIAIAQAQIAIASRHFGEARDRLLAVHDGVKQPSQRIQVNLLLGEALVALNLGNEAKDALEQNLVLTREIDPASQELTRNILGLAYYQLGMYMLAAECHRQCLTAINSRIIRDPSFELSVRNNLGNDYMQLSQHKEAIEIFQSATELGQKLLTPQSLAELYWQISDTYRHDGQTPQAQRYAEMAAEHLKIAADRQIFAHVQSSLGLAYAEQNDNERAETTLIQARDLAERAGDEDGRSIALASLSRVQLARNDAPGARKSAQEALRSAEATGNREALGRAYLALGEALSAENNGAAADENFGKGLKLLEDAGSQAELTRAYEHYADLLAQRGDSVRAFDFLKKARSTSMSR